MSQDDDAWEVLTTGRSSNAGLEAWSALPDGTFRQLDRSEGSPQREPLAEANSGASNHPVRASLAELKAAGRARAKTAKAAVAAEEATQRQAEALWPSTFDFVFDSTWEEARCSDFLYNIGAEVRGRTVLCFVPGFASWSSLTQEHVDRWNAAGVLDERDADSAHRQALGIVVKWPCGRVRWSSENAQVEAAAAWQEAHGATLAAARALTVLLQKLKALECSVVVAAHSLGARVVLQALANDLAAPKVEGLLVLGGAVDNHALTGLRGTAGEVNGIIYDGVGAAPVEFPFARLMSKCSAVALVHSTSDPVLRSLWQPAEYARCGRSAPPALGLTGIVEEELEEAVEDDESWMERVTLLDVTEDMSETHDPLEYLLGRRVTAVLHGLLFP